jgi:hypothetical protein
MSVTELQPNDTNFQGTVVRRELLELLQMLHRTCASGVLHLDSAADRASLCLDRGTIRAAFFNHLVGSPALSRILMLGSTHFFFELGTAHTVARVVLNITKDTALILATVERMLEEHASSAMHRAVAPPTSGAPASSPSEPTAQLVDRDATSGPDPVATGETSETGTARLSFFNPPQPGTVLGKCELLCEIGRGSCSVVYKAHHRSLGLDVVVKVLMPDSGETAHHRQLTANEAQLLARLNHPNILRIFDFCEDGEHPHLIFEYVDGPSLAGLITTHTRLESELALPLFCQAIEALSHAHDAMQLVHCDLKPTNILLTQDYRVKIADFGLAKAQLELSSTQLANERGTIAGTPAYISPEQVEGGRQAADHRSDIYSLGATMYHAVTGRLPFLDADPLQMMVRRLGEAPIPPHLVHPKVDRRLSQLIMSMMARDPNNRVQTYEELLELTGDLLENTIAATQRPRAPLERDSRIIRRRTSFWNYVPNRASRSGGGAAGQAAG